VPFNRPALPDLISRAEGDLQSRLGVGPLLKRSFLAVIARMSAGAAHQLYGYLDWIAQQVLPDTAVEEILERWASIWGIKRIAASYAVGSVTLTTNTVGVTTVIPAGTLLTRSDGAQFASTTDVVIVGAGSFPVPVSALTAGVAGNTPAGSQLQLVSPIAGVNSFTTASAGGLAGGAETEGETSLRARLLARIRRAPNGGSKADYVTWALENAGVTRAWCYPNNTGLGTVGVAIVTDDAPGGPLPAQQVVDAVQAYIEERRPVTAEVTVYAPEPLYLNLSIALSPNTLSVQNAITVELQDLFRRRSEPGGVIYFSEISEAISTAAGEAHHSILSSSYTGTGNFLLLGAITWSTEA
jgi:uncharacterized phage protein gp47/JayE